MLQNEQVGAPRELEQPFLEKSRKASINPEWAPEMMQKHMKNLTKWKTARRRPLGFRCLPFVKDFQFLPHFQSPFWVDTGFSTFLGSPTPATSSTAILSKGSFFIIKGASLCAEMQKVCHSSHTAPHPMVGS